MKKIIGIVALVSSTILASPYKATKDEERAFISSIVKPGDLVFDIGAYKGEKTELYRSLSARVVSVEPQIKYSKYIEDRYSHDSNVYVVDKGISDSHGILKLYPNETISTFSTDWFKGRFSGSKWGKPVDVEVVTLDALIEQYGVPHFCKIDVEGFESKVIGGLTHFINYLSFEFASEVFHTNTISALEKLIDLGYKKFNISYAWNSRFHFEDWVSYDVLIETIQDMMKEDQKLWGDIYAFNGLGNL